MASDLRFKESAEMLFEPTGDLVKDYSAYCETEDRPERDDLVDSIRMIEQRDVDGVTRVKTCIIARNLDYCLNKRDLVPLANAIPHCPTLASVQFTGCGITEHSLKVLVEAVFKSPSATIVGIDFNPNGLFKDPTVAKKDKNEVFLLPAQLRSAHLRPPEEHNAFAAAAAAAAADKKGAKPDPKKAAAAAAAAVAVKQDETPIAVPTGFHALLLTAVQSISLRGNGITDKQLEPLAAFLESNTELLSLSLWGNQITSVGATSLAKALKWNRRLTALNLGSNKIDDVGATALANALMCIDATNEEATKLRVRALRLPPTTALVDLPPLPTWQEMCAAIAVPEDPKAKDPKAKATAPPAAKGGPKGGKGGVEGPVERPKGEFDRDCFRVDEFRVRVPGNTTLWGLDLSMNSITPAALRTWINVLRSREPPLNHEEPITPPPNYMNGGIVLERLEVDTNTPELAALKTELQSALTDARKRPTADA